ncbi:MAG: hypothetical protein ABJC79_04345 [Acidimicrobiia bacterium]
MSESVEMVEGGRAVRRRSRKRKVAVLALSLTAALGATAALAAWTVGGGGSGTATAVSSQNLTTSVATTTAALYPGITGANLYLTVNNPNPFAVTITSVNANGAATADAGHVSCVTTGVTYTTTAVSKVVPATGSLSFTVPSVAMSNTSDNGCQGATFTVPVTFTAGS